MVLIQPGDFMMGSPDSDQDAANDEKLPHPVRITRPFYLGVHEVTQRQYRTVIGSNPSSFKESDDLPVDQVSWNDAIVFCNKLSDMESLKPCYETGGGLRSSGDGYRLPTEAEWEYACRAGSTTRYSFGDETARLGGFAWHHGNSERRTHPVGQRKRPNAWGLYDMYGNVFEWCWDWYDEGYYKKSPGADPPGPSQGTERVVRGGGWTSLAARECRSASRGKDAPTNKHIYLGFRVARVWTGP
jgi:formylglycine-generating enzyme required for sulfatase activity